MSLFIGDGLNGDTADLRAAGKAPWGYARGADGSLVPVGEPVDHGPLARFWRWPTRWLPDGLSEPVVGLATVAFHALLVWGLYRLAQRHLK